MDARLVHSPHLVGHEWCCMRRVLPALPASIEALHLCLSGPLACYQPAPLLWRPSHPQAASKLAAAQAYAGQVQLQLQAAQGAVPRTQAALAAKDKEVRAHAWRVHGRLQRCLTEQGR